MGKISGTKAKAFWHNPRNGESKEIGDFDNKGQQNSLFPLLPTVRVRVRGQCWMMEVSTMQVHNKKHYQG